MARSDGPSARAPGRSLLSAGPSWVARRSTLVSVVRVWFRVPGSSRSAWRRLASWLAMASKLALEASTNVDTWRSRSARAVASSWKLCTTRRTLRRRLATSRVIFSVSAAGGLQPPEDLAQLRRRVALERLAAAVEQDAQVRPGVGVQRRQELVRVHVGQGVRGRDRLARGQLAGPRVAGIQLQEHVLEPRLGPQQDAGVAVHRHVLAPDLHVDLRLAVHQAHAADLAHLDAGDVHRLALPGHDGLGGGHLGLHVL